jgi:deazaflavin-dependent oxidoreductase (nitroreductase family)
MLCVLHSCRWENGMAGEKPYFLKESVTDRIFNRFFGFLVSFGIGARYNYLLETRGRKTGKVYATPVNLLEMDGHRYLVAVRGETGWVRNARAAGSLSLRKGSTRMDVKVREIAVEERPPMLKEFLDRYAGQVQRFYPVPKGSPVEAFKEMASRAPVFELIG